MRVATVLSLVVTSCIPPVEATGESQQRLGGNDTGAGSCASLLPDKCRVSQECELVTSCDCKDPQGCTGGCVETCVDRQPPVMTDPCASLDERECLLKSPFCTLDKKCESDGRCTAFCHSATPTADRCAGLSERQCNSASGCQGQYRVECKPMVDGKDQGCSELFAGCFADSSCR